MHDIIFNELCLGTIDPVSNMKYLEIINTLVQNGAQGIVLGCTETPVLIRQDDVEVPVFNAIAIHATEP